MHHPENIPPALSFRFRADGECYCVAFRAAAFHRNQKRRYLGAEQHLLGQQKI